MHYETITERKAKEALNTLSFCDHLRHWSDFNNLPKIAALSSK